MERPSIRRSGLSGQPWRPAAVALALLAVVAAPRRSEARAAATFTYSRDVVWNTAVRMLRVDLRYEISEQDKDNGYILFAFVQNGRDYNGSVEFVEGTGEAESSVIEVSVSVGGLPEGAEENLLRKLKTKLRADYGMPPTPRATQPPPTPEPTPAEPGEPSSGPVSEGDETAESPE